MKQCSIEECHGKNVAFGLCAKHYMRLRRHGDPFKESFPIVKVNVKCSEDPKTYCRLYYREYRKIKPEWNDYIKNYNKERHANMRRIVFNHYGTSCKICGDSTFENLCIDHINNDGYWHRLELETIPNGRYFYYWLIQNNFPPGFQTLCQKCNRQKWEDYKIDDTEYHLRNIRRKRQKQPQSQPQPEGV